MLENKFKTNLIKKINKILPGCIVLHIDPNETQGMPDLLFLYGDRWGALEGKKTWNAEHQPNQDYYVYLMNRMSFARFVSPENEQEVLNDIQQAFKL